MIVNVQDLIHIIQCLPPPDKVKIDEYHVPMVESPTLLPYIGIIPRTGIIKEIIFKKNGRGGNACWCLEI